MRRQYHSIETARGRLFWDVHRLVELSRSFPRRSVLLQDISEFDDRSWFADSESSPTHKEVAFHAKLIQEADLQYPIILGEDGRVMDGMHRVCKAWMQGDTSVTAVQFETDPAPDYVNVSEDTLPYEEPW